MSPLVPHPGPPNSISGDGEFVGVNTPLRPLAAQAATISANSFLDAGLGLARVTCSAVTTKPSPKHEYRVAIRPFERRYIKVVFEVDGWPNGEDTFGVDDQTGMEFRISYLLERNGITRPRDSAPRGSVASRPDSLSRAGLAAHADPLSRGGLARR